MNNIRRPIKWYQYLTNPDILINSILDRIVKNKRFDWYEIKENNIVHHDGAKEEIICIDQVTYWKVRPEMTFDVIEIGSRNELVKYFPDYYNDLTKILSENLADKIKE